MNKVVENVSVALNGIEDGMTLMLGGFGLCGIPENAIKELSLKQSNLGHSIHTIKNNLQCLQRDITLGN